MGACGSIPTPEEIESLRKELAEVSKILNTVTAALVALVREVNDKLEAWAALQVDARARVQELQSQVCARVEEVNEVLRRVQEQIQRIKGAAAAAEQHVRDAAEAAQRQAEQAAAAGASAVADAQSAVAGLGNALGRAW